MMPPRCLRLILVAGLLAAVAVCYGIVSHTAVEGSKASEAFNYLSAVRAAQERYHSQHSIYANNLIELDINMSPPKYFAVDKVVVSEENDTWTMTMTRGAPDAGFGQHTVVFNQDGVANSSTISEDNQE